MNTLWMHCMCTSLIKAYKAGACCADPPRLLSVQLNPYLWDRCTPLLWEAIWIATQMAKCPCFLALV